VRVRDTNGTDKIWGEFNSCVKTTAPENITNYQTCLCNHVACTQRHVPSGVEQASASDKVNIVLQAVEHTAFSADRGTKGYHQRPQSSRFSPRPYPSFQIPPSSPPICSVAPQLLCTASQLCLRPDLACCLARRSRAVSLHCTSWLLASVLKHNSRRFPAQGCRLGSIAVSLYDC
jgi:hypothetical protein